MHGATMALMILDYWSAVLLALCLFLLLLYGTWPFRVWSQLGVPGPQPLPFLGNGWTIARKGLFNATLEWSCRYGRVHGIYLMREPLLLTTDLDILKQIFVKDFANFSYRAPSLPLLPPPVHLGLSIVGGQQWKRQRDVMTPSFSTKKLKTMGYFIRRCCTNLIHTIDKSVEAGKPLDLKTLYGAYTLDVIAGTVLGMETNSLAENENVFLNNAKAVLGGSSLVTLPSVLAATFPFLVPLLKVCGCSLIPVKETHFVTTTIRTLVEQRRLHPEKKSSDLLQLLLNAEVDDSEVTTGNSPRANHLTREEIVAQGITFFVAGYDTTSICLQFLSYLLALHPHTQDRLYREIVDTLGDAEACYDNVVTLPYLDCCLRETLRLYPPLPIIARKVSETWKVGEGVTLPSGSSVGTPVYALMRDERNFSQPNSFIPERFEEDKERIHSFLKDMVFGAGPRHCIGMRLALYEAKMAIVSVLRNFRFAKVEETLEEITLKASTTCTPVKPLVIGYEPRHHRTTPTDGQN